MWPALAVVLVLAVFPLIASLGLAFSFFSFAQGGFEIRTFLTVSAAARGARGTIHFYAPIPIFAVGCTIATYSLAGG